MSNRNKNTIQKNIKLSKRNHYLYTFGYEDGCRNILPACVDADFQNNNSVLLDAYKKTDLDAESNLALFAVSSIVTDKAEPSEGLFANVCWFSTEDTILISPDSASDFSKSGKIAPVSVVKGKRPSAYICKEIELAPQSSESWYQVFDTRLDAVKISLLKKELSDRAVLAKALEKDITAGKELMETYITEADGFQKNGYTHIIGKVVTTIVARRTDCELTCCAEMPAGIETTAFDADALATTRYRYV